MASFRLAAHNEVLAILRQLDGEFLGKARCYFGGGTRIVLELGEYRESKDIDFLCADVAGYRALRESISQDSLGAVAKAGLRLARDVRADQYGIRTAVQCASGPVKLEIVREARIGLDGSPAARLPVPCLSRLHCFAEKLLANADRGMDSSTLSRDAVDLAFMVQGWGKESALAGAELARVAYGPAIDRELALTVSRLRRERTFRARTIEGLGIEETSSLAAGLEVLARGLDPGGPRKTRKGRP